jgi:hypothetical protein
VFMTARSPMPCREVCLPGCAHGFKIVLPEEGAIQACNRLAWFAANSIRPRSHGRQIHSNLGYHRQTNSLKSVRFYWRQRTRKSRSDASGGGGGTDTDDRQRRATASHTLRTCQCDRERCGGIPKGARGSLSHMPCLSAMQRRCMRRGISGHWRTGFRYVVSK